MDFLKGMSCLERNDDVLTEILLRLPSKSIFKFTCVTTRWSNVIKDRNFRKLFCERTRRSLTCSNPHGKLLGLVQTDNKYCHYISRPFADPVHSFMSVHGEEYVSNAACGGDLFPVERGYFITCTDDGLFLCGRIPNRYYVGNPITGKWETLPPPPSPPRNSMKHVSVGLSSNKEEDGLGGTITNFRVIVLPDCFYVYPGYDSDIPGVKEIPIETYSSKTKVWRRSSLVSKRDKVWMIAFIPWDPKRILIRHWERIFIYDCMQKKLDEVVLDGYRHFTDLTWEWYPYFQSLSS